MKPEKMNPENDREPKKMIENQKSRYRNILFICNGNTCRSPMAEYMLKKRLSCKFKDNKEFQISSAGIYAHPNEKATEEAKAVMAKYEIDLSSHTSRRLNSRMVEEADIILTMTVSQREEIKKKWPEKSENKVYTVKEFAMLIGESNIKENFLDIVDPYGLSASHYEECLREIDAALKLITERI